MKAMVLSQTAPLSEVPEPLRSVELATPKPAESELLIRVAACGVCHTELDEIEGRLRPPHLPIVLGHEVVGCVVERGKHVTRFANGDRVGVGWIHHSSGDEDENLSPQFAATGCDVNGGYAQFMTVPEDYAVAIPDALSDTQAAPLMCAGAIGYRALRLTGLRDGQPLGLMGFGGSGHLVLPTAKHLYPNSPVYVFTRDESVQQFACDLAADWAGDIDAVPPQPLQAIIDTTPAWKPVVESMKKLRPGGRLVINAIRKEDADKDELLNLSYHEHLWMEREIKSVANLTHRDIAEFLPLAAEIPLRPEVTLYPLDQANEALRNLRRGQIKGANVLVVS
ncbi:zinc-binding alcohol dehydrogenase family protein [Rhodopirellula maiorica SM1]|uniref:alcohol dehydrogenase n=1 Tax=Rhodopirellula maiorica SM1 TaxID=1265738 RepID=M5RT41_9BACT|nr:alcohol dehydrogenase catalytic domain-containing protein [Rhodopirellula maiorica]EMI18557.1 zinc-binding alcohol dehydrogenase family protein [Rhodopirellula maiorica SM1]